MRAVSGIEMALWIRRQDSTSRRRRCSAGNSATGCGMPRGAENMLDKGSPGVGGPGQGARSGFTCHKFSFPHTDMKVDFARP
jgi:hypothetical protein